jgi:hypothetical protein
MELVDGRDLSVVLSDEGALSLKRAAHLVSRIAAALQAAHETGIVHLDLKPSNVLVTFDGEQELVKLVDFGLSRTLHEPGLEARSEPLIASLGYLAPERISDPNDTQERSDQFSLAVLAYEMITGVAAFPSSGNATEDLAALAECRPVSPRLRKPEIPMAVERVLAMGMSRAPEDRFRTVLDFAEALSAAIGRAPGVLWAPVARMRSAIWAAALLSGAEAFDFVLRVQAIGAGAALHSAIEDSAKTVFHLVQLPIAAGLLVLRLPRSLVTLALRSYRLVTVSLALVCFSAVTAVTRADMREAVCERLTLPEDVADLSLRADLLALRARAASSPQTRGLLRLEYMSRLDQVRRPTCHYEQLASWRATFSGLLTYIGLLFAAFVVFLLSIQVLISGFHRSAALETLGACILVCTPWIVLRTFTERQVNFGVLEIGNYKPITVALGAAALAAVLMLLGNASRRALLNIAVAAGVALATAFVIVGFFIPAGATLVVHQILALPAVHLGATGIAVALAVAAFAFSAGHNLRVRRISWPEPARATQTQALPAQAIAPDDPPSHER